jgi:hypothetical protein
VTIAAVLLVIQQALETCLPIVEFAWKKIYQRAESILYYSHVKQLQLDDFRLHASNLARIDEGVCEGWPRIAKDVRILESLDGDFLGDQRSQRM